MRNGRDLRGRKEPIEGDGFKGAMDPNKAKERDKKRVRSSSRPRQRFSKKKKKKKKQIKMKGDSAARLPSDRDGEYSKEHVTEISVSLNNTEE